MYCQKPQLKLFRHCETHHETEKYVQEILHLEKGTKIRKQKIAALRNEGNLRHNQKVWTSNVGVIVPRKRPTLSCDAIDYLPCEYCSGAFVRACLSMHQKSCSQLHGKKRSKRAQANAKMMIAFEADDYLKEKVLSRMTVGKITSAVLRDPIILQFGSGLLRSHSQSHGIMGLLGDL